MKAVSARAPAIAAVMLLFPLLRAGDLPGLKPDLASVRPGLASLKAGLEVHLQALSGMVVHENISRYVQTGRNARKIDDFRLFVEMDAGLEQYSDVQANGERYEHFSQIPGTWSFGEIAAILRTTRDSLDEWSTSIREASVSDGSAVRVTSFHYSAASKRWFVTVGSEVHWLDFDGEVRTEPLTGEVLSLRWISTSVPAKAGIESIQWLVRFGSVDIAGEAFIMPEIAEYRVTRQAGRRVDWNVTRFEGWNRYGSQSTIRFGN